MIIFEAPSDENAVFECQGGQVLRNEPALAEPCRTGDVEPDIVGVPFMFKRALAVRMVHDLEDLRFAHPNRYPREIIDVVVGRSSGT